MNSFARTQPPSLFAYGRRALVVVLWCLAVFVCIWAVSGAQKRLERESLARADSRLLDFAQLVGGVVRAEIDLHSTLLNTVAHSSQGDLQAAADIVRGLTASGQWRWILLSDTKGRVLAANDDFPYGTVNLSDRAYFNQIMQGGTPPEILGEALETRANTRGVILARRLERPDGQVTGMLVTALEVDVLSVFLEKLSLLPDDAVLFARPDGYVYFWYGSGNDVFATFSAGLVPNLRHPADQVFESVSPIDAKVRRGCLTEVAPGLLLYVGRTPEDINREHAAAARFLKRLLPLLLLLVSALSVLAFSRAGGRNRRFPVNGTSAADFSGSFPHMLPAAEFISALDDAGPGALILINSNGLEQMRALLGAVGTERVQEEIAGLVREHAVQNDLLGRIEETVFALFQPGADADAAAYTARLLHEALSAHLMRAGNFAAVCIGVACFARRTPGREMLSTAQGLLQEARVADGDYVIQCSF